MITYCYDYIQILLTPLDLVSMRDLAKNWCSESTTSRKRVPASGVIFNTTGKGNNSSTEDKDQKKI